MRILVVNPNSTASMTEKIGACARSVAARETEIFAANPTSTPTSIEGYYDEAMSVPGLLAEVEAAERDGIDGIVIACDGGQVRVGRVRADGGKKVAAGDYAAEIRLKTRARLG